MLRTSWTKPMTRSAEEEITGLEDDELRNSDKVGHC